MVRPAGEDFESVEATAFVALGSSLGDRLATLASAVRSIGSLPMYRGGLRASQVYETDPAAPPATERFLNAMIAFSFVGGASALLAELHRIEAAHGRDRAVSWADRTLDLDLVYVRELDGRGRVEESEDLQLPHPRAGLRDFVLAPLRDLAPDLLLPGGRCAELLDGLPPDVRTIRRSVDFELGAILSE